MFALFAACSAHISERRSETCIAHNQLLVQNRNRKTTKIIANRKKKTNAAHYYYPRHGCYCCYCCCRRCVRFQIEHFSRCPHYSSSLNGNTEGRPKDGRNKMRSHKMENSFTTAAHTRRRKKNAMHNVTTQVDTFI